MRLLVSELVTNSLRHAELRPGGLDHPQRQRRRTTRVRVEVSDPGPGLRARRATPTTARPSTAGACTSSPRWRTAGASNAPRTRPPTRSGSSSTADRLAHGSVVAFAPGRVNLLGEHTDCAGGLALPFAIELGVTVRVTPLPGALYMAVARDLGETDVFHEPGPATGWRAFVRGTVAELGVPAGAHRDQRQRATVGGGLSSSRGARVRAGARARAATATGPARSRGSPRASRTSGSARGPGCSTSTRRCWPSRATRCGSTSAPTPSSRSRSSSAAGGWSSPAPARATSRRRATTTLATCRAPPSTSRPRATRVRAFARRPHASAPLLDASHAALRDARRRPRSASEAVVARLRPPARTGPG